MTMMSQHLRMRAPEDVCRMAAMMRWENLVGQGDEDPLPWMNLTDAQKLPWLVAAHGALRSAGDVMVWQYPNPLIPGITPNEDGDYPDHTPYLGLGPEGVAVVRCGGATIETSHQTFDSLSEWAQHFSGEEAEKLRGIIIDREVADYKRENGLR